MKKKYWLKFGFLFLIPPFLFLLLVHTPHAASGLELGSILLIPISVFYFYFDGNGHAFFGNLLNHQNLSDFIVLQLINFVSYFIIGAILGLVFGKIKKLFES